MSNIVKPLIIYHANCADGFGAAFTAWLKLGEEAEYYPAQYGNKGLEKALSGTQIHEREIYILDFSYSRAFMGNLFANAKRVVWLDHHRSAFEMWCENGERQFFEWMFASELENDSYIKLDNSKSGAMIAWEYFHPDKEVPMLIKHIDDYDRWQFKIEGTKEFNKALWSYAPWSFEQWHSMLFTQTGFSVEDGWEERKSTVDMFYTEGAAILRAHDANVQAVVNGAVMECNIDYIELELQEDATELAIQHYVIGLAANCPPYLASDVGHQLAMQSGTYGLLWFINKEGKCLCSLRSNGDYDVSAIAHAFGGGGHKNAAGFEVAIETLLEWIK